MRTAKVLVASATAAVALAAVAGGAGAMPRDRHAYEMEGTCDGQAVTLVDQNGSPTAFNKANGHVGVGKIFQGVNLDTGEILFEETYGQGFDRDRLIQCDFVSEVTNPDGSTFLGSLRVFAHFPRGL